MRKFLLSAALASCLICGAGAKAAQIDVTVLQPTITPGGGWGVSVGGGGTASIVDLTGVGGNLELNQPIPVGAALLTTGDSDSDRAEIGISDNFGEAAAFLGKLEAAYSYFKVAMGNPAAAPSLRLTIATLGGAGDNFGTLIFEPYWNVGGGLGVPTTGDWETVTIDGDTGSGDDNAGGWWWTGGFEIPNGAGGPPLRSANEWVDAFLASDPVDFANANVVGISLAVGTYNRDQIGYFDQLVIGETTYNFDTVSAAAVPEPATMALMGLGLLGVPYIARRRKATQSA